MWNCNNSWVSIDSKEYRIRQATESITIHILWKAKSIAAFIWEVSLSIIRELLEKIERVKHKQSSKGVEDEVTSTGKKDSDSEVGVKWIAGSKP